MASGLGSSAKPLIFSVNRSRAQDEGDWKVTCPKESLGPWRIKCERSFLVLWLSASLLATLHGLPERMTETSRQTRRAVLQLRKNRVRTAKPGTPAAPNPAIESELQQLRQLVQEQAERLHGLQQRLADVEGELAAGKSAPTSAASSATSAVQPAPPPESAASSASPAARQRNDGDQEKKPSPLYF